MDKKQRDAHVLMLYENWIKALKSDDEWNRISEDEGSAGLNIRMTMFKEMMEFERRLIEEISLPARFILEHFSYLLNHADYLVSFSYGQMLFGSGRLNLMKIKEWGNIELTIGGTDIRWRDEEVQYLFYPNKVTIRNKDSLKHDDINLMFNYQFNHAQGLLHAYQDVKDDKQTLYWHEKLESQ